MKKEISVIIVTYNSEKHIYDCLDSLFKYNDIGDALEVIIVDNQSSSFCETRAKLERQYGTRIIIIENDKNGGYGQGNNVGIRASSAPIIMIMNPDIRLIEPLFKGAIEAFEKRDVVQYGIKLLDNVGNLTSSIGISKRLPAYIKIPLSRISNKRGWFSSKDMYLVGACFFMRKSSFENVGLFDERIFMYGEEQDVHDRLMKFNPHFKIIYNKNKACLHLHGLYADKSKPEYVDYEPKALRCSIEIQGRNGVPRNKVIEGRISIMKMKLYKAKVLYFFKRDQYTKDYMDFLISFIKDMRDMLTEGKE